MSKNSRFLYRSYISVGKKISHSRLKLRLASTSVEEGRRYDVCVCVYVLRVINYKFYLSPGYGLTPMKRKMSSACVVRTRTLQRKKAEILVHRTLASLSLSSLVWHESAAVLAIRTKAGNPHVRENRGAKSSRSCRRKLLWSMRNIDDH